MATHLLHILEHAARIAPHNGSLFYDDDNANEPRFVSYPRLFQLATTTADKLLNQNIIANGDVVVLHFNRHAGYIPWFWSIIAAGAIPAISTPLAADPQAKARHLNHLQSLLKNPRIITTRSLEHEFSGVDGLDIVTVDSLADINGISAEIHGYSNASTNETSDRLSYAGTNNFYANCSARSDNASDLAFLMLTSGSTGNAKAVEEHHTNVIAAVEGKAHEFGTTKKDVFFNWIGFDHVACVTEMHLHAVLTGALDIHAIPSMLLQDPLLWLKTVEKHSVTHAFAPNFFLGTLNSTIDNTTDANYDVSSLRTVVSGGEANVSTTGIAFNKKMHAMGAASSVLVPAFGMTETCGGCTYHRKFPALEKLHTLQFTAVGKPTNAIQFRVCNDAGVAQACGIEGHLELSGHCVFPAYYNDAKNTESSFTQDGWFKTGDKAYIDASGALVMSGRVKDSIIINGVKYFSHELESALEEAKLDGLVPSYTASFSTQPVGYDSEELIIVFLPTQTALDDSRILSRTIEFMNKTAVLYCNKKPLAIIPLPENLLPKSALGKLSRPKLKTAYEEGNFAKYVEEVNELIAKERTRRRVPPNTGMEKQLIDLYSTEFNVAKEEIGINSSLLDIGIDSLALFRFKGLVQKRLQITDISMTVFLMNPIIMNLASAIERLKTEPMVYNPVVTMQNGDAPVSPIWFFHPGLGEVLVFLNLSKYFSDRMVYGIRAPGFNPSEERFKTLNEMIDTYVVAIRKKQPHGPYVLLGYSYGGLVTYNVAKRLEALRETVQFCGIMNLPPHVKYHMREMDWCELFLTLLSFMGFITEKQAFEWKPVYCKLPKEEVVKRVLEVVDHRRLEELDLDANKLDLWAGIANSVQSLARDYDPSGSVACLDVFYAIPIYRVSADRDKKAWFDNEVSQWQPFARSPVRYHDCPGTHHTMIDPENVFIFQKILKAAMKERNVD